MQSLNKRKSERLLVPDRKDFRNKKITKNQFTEKK